MPPPAQVTIAMSQHLGAPCEPVVQVGDHVEVGQVIGDSDQFVSAPVHASVSGTVSAVTTLLLPGGRTTKALVIDSDGEQRVHESVRPPGSSRVVTADTVPDTLACTGADTN